MPLIIQHAKKSLRNALENKSKITDGYLNVPGYSTPAIKHLLNNLCSLPNAHYLEIGVMYDSTFISALYQNTSTLKNAIAIGNWSQFGKSRNPFLIIQHEFYHLDHSVFMKIIPLS